MGNTGSDLAQRAERAGNRVAVPFAWDLGVGQLVRQTAAQASNNHLPAFAGNLAYRALFALFPSVIALLWLLTRFHAEGLVNSLVELVATALPQAAAEPLRHQLSSAPQAQASGTVTASAVLGALIALWALAGTFRAAMEALNVVYAVEERRPLWQRYSLSLGFSLAVTLLLVGALLLVIFGKAIAVRGAEVTGLGIVFRWAWAIVSWPVLAGLVLTACALIYRFAPDCERRVRWISTGAVVATVLWLLFTVVFSIYINRFAEYRAVYGALAGIAVLMIYVYGSAFILLLGAEMNRVVERHALAGPRAGDRTGAS